VVGGAGGPAATRRMKHVRCDKNEHKFVFPQEVSFHNSSFPILAKILTMMNIASWMISGSPFSIRDIRFV
jgi:hypothetical protein